MHTRLIEFLFLLLFVSTSISALSQNDSHRETKFVILLDSLKRNELIFNGEQKKPEIKFSADQAVRYLEQKMRPEIWKNTHDPLRQAIGQLVFSASHPPIDSAEYFLNRYPFDSIKVPWDKFYTREQLHCKIPVIQSPIPAVGRYDSVRIAGHADSLKNVLPEAPGLVSRQGPTADLKDTTIMVLIDTLHEVVPDYKDFPFTFYEYPYQGDSIEVAVRALLDFTMSRDSSILNISGSGKSITPIWLNSRSGRMQRYWLKNDLNDSVTVWIGSNSRNNLGLYLEDGVTFRRPVREGNYSQARVELREIDRSKLLSVKQITVRQQYWKYRTEASFALNQAAVSNWVKGGESSVSTALDITGYADYENKPLRITSNNFARIKFGLIATGNNNESNKLDVQKNIDLLETNSKVNHKAFGKFDFSAILLFKTQIAKGYNYPNDSVPVSKFFNPAILTVGIGLDYQPDKTTSINLSPLSYKGTFVPDTLHIDKSKYGILPGHRSLNEPGASLVISNEFKPYKTVTVTNRLQLFTNYIHNPQNVDVDWEVIATASLNWFTEMRLNTHLIFDDDTRTQVLDKNKKPVLESDGTPKKTARVQFKELLGLSFMFRF
ncbi:MAG: DUF3078 domain-containing protein [Bacteroidales bacterium]